MSAIVHRDLIDASELDSLLQRLTTAQNDKERLRHLKTAARNYTFDASQPAAVRVKSGDVIEVQCLDASDRKHRF